MSLYYEEKNCVPLKNDGNPISLQERACKETVKYAATYLYINDVYVVRPKLP